MEAVVSGSTDTHTPADPFFLFDATLTGRLHDGLDIVVRPYAHRLSGGDWTAEMYQLQLRYMTPTRVPVRVEAGILSSPLGLNTLELLPSKNPTISAPFFYFAPLPRFDTRYAECSSCPAAIRWVSSPAVRARTGTRASVSPIESDASPKRAVEGWAAVLGAVHCRRRLHAVRRAARRREPGPRAFSRAGGGSAGPRRRRHHVRGRARIRLHASLGRVDTRPVRDHDDPRGGARVEHRRDADAHRPVVPRRPNDRVSAPVFETLLDQPRQTADSSDVTLGYRLRADFTLRAGYQHPAG